MDLLPIGSHSLILSFAKLTDCRTLLLGAMKFPLPKSPFPTLLLSPEDKRSLAAVTEVIVKTNLQQYHELLTVHNGAVDERRWEKIKQRDDVCVYRERQSFADRSTISSSLLLEPSSSSSANSTTDKSSTTAELKDLSKMLTFGSVTGNLDDVTYGSLSLSAKEMQLKSAYVGDSFVDCAVLASIIKPSAQDPFLDLSIKWTVKGHSLLIDAVMRARGVVVIESVGIAIASNGERIGYHLHHSVDIPEIRELHELQIVRGRVSLCQLFRQHKENCVEVCPKIHRPQGQHVWEFRLGHGRRGAHLGPQAHTLRRDKETRAVFGLDTPTQLQFDSIIVIRYHMYRVWPERERRHRSLFTRKCQRQGETVLQSLRGKIEKELSETSVEVCTHCMLRVSCKSSVTFAALDVLAGKGESVDYSQALE